MSLAHVFVVLLLAFPTMAACVECGASVAEVSALRQFLANEPTQLAHIAITEGKTEFLGVAGYSLVVPGVDSPRCPIDRALVRIMPATTDVICGLEHAQLINRASAFAAKYNAVVKDFLVSKGAFSCAK